MKCIASRREKSRETTWQLGRIKEKKAKRENVGSYRTEDNNKTGGHRSHPTPTKKNNNSKINKSA